MAGERLRGALASYGRRYRKASPAERSRLLDEFSQLTAYHPKYATTLLNRRDESNGRRRCRGPTYSRKSLEVIEAVWRGAGYPWSVSLEALIPQWLPWARRHIDGLTPEVEKAVISISPRQSDSRLASKKRSLRGARYEEARTPLEHLADHYGPRGLPQAVEELLALRRTVNPFELSSTIDRKLRRIEAVKSLRRGKELGTG